ncbi:MFS transporter [Silicimonas algicola]|uniref:MFS transporter n=1 Tax=Silicimonas algicola TaxID=1826607 RepID=A0A316G7B2_9RHOB|nr:MFS transporter [Silicimonas algicola]AZQ67157.1 MFS transporter [Silicimonas algicola]PWK56804.1 MFS transporter [Silicimonas algicola]
MLQVIRSAWPLLLGIILLMVGNGLQGSLMGIRGGIEQFSTIELSVITSAYFVGFLFGSRTAPGLIRRVGHVRVFAALGSFISAVLILYPTITEPWAWVLLRVLFGFSFSGVYVTAESWLNNSSTNENRGKALSLYMIVQMVGIMVSQALLNVADPAGYVLFVIPSVLVSLSFAPILLSVTPTPEFDTTKAMNLRALYNTSPTGIVGMFLMGFAFSALFGMASVYGTAAGMSVAEISIFVTAIFFGGLVLQFPIGWMSDRMDRRKLILFAGVGGALGSLLGLAFGGSFEMILVAGFILGGVSNPLYALIIAYTNDYLPRDDMAAASGALIFVNGLGAIAGPILTGWLMGNLGPPGFWVFLAANFTLFVAYVAYRMTQRVSLYEGEGDYDAVTYAPLTPSATPIAVEAAQEFYADNAPPEQDIAASQEERVDRQ